MATKSDYKELQQFLESIAPHQIENMSIVEPLEKFPVLLHISRDKSIKEFVPVVSPRTMKKEDRSVPRVCTAPHLFGCFVGYSAASADFGMDRSPAWKGGYYIYALPCTLAVAPSKKILPDVNETSERWIVGYNDKHRAIKPTIVGKCFLHSVTTIGLNDGHVTDYTLYAEIKGGVVGEDLALDIVPFNEELTLTKGYYRISINDNRSQVYWNPKDITVSQIPKAEYDKAKTVTAGLLSFEGGPSATW